SLLLASLTTLQTPLHFHFDLSNGRPWPFPSQLSHTFIYLFIYLFIIFFQFNLLFLIHSNSFICNMYMYLVWFI
ncbi:MAG: hypothetical protein N7Q72_06110, partial [Spiroplasma sp. Tabriz.8]|nr:hypothetical protein [Spiroplasma sp. Tabriz.8]